MEKNAVFVKTDAGRDEMQTRSRKLPPGLRSILLLVDGQRDVAQLRTVCAGLHAPPDALESLASMGLIAPLAREAAPAAAPAAAPPSAAAPAIGDDAARRYATLHGLMSEAVGQHLGLRGYFTQLKIERCGTVEELVAAMDDLHAAMVKAKGQSFADSWVAGVRAAGLA